MAQGKPETGSQEVTQEGSQAQEVKQSKFVAEEATRLAQENISTEQRQSLVDRLYKDPIAYARENNTPGSLSENFINSLEQQPTTKEKITVFRGVGNNVMSDDNSSTLWVAENEEVAKNYAGTSEDGTLNIESLEVDKPSNPIEMPYKLATDVRGSDIANNLRSVAAELKKSGKLPKENISKALELISDFESKAGNNLELFTTKLNKPEANEAFSKAVQALGFDGVIQKEAAVRDGEMSNTYGIFKNTYANLLQDNQKETNFVQNETGNIQPERTGDGRGRTESRKLTPLEGAPTVPGINGPDPQIVGVAEQYAADNGIELKRQSEYVEVDEQRAKRIADAYEQMADNTQDPKVKEAYEDLIKQTIAQYKALADAGYKFWFINTKIPSNDEYASTPYNALRDLRQNKEMGVFPTADGYGEEGITQEQRENNPLLQDTGIMWPVGGLDGEMMPVLANDLFRAVHDAFGHGLEGAGFRARGEENAWQAHVRLFTGPAVAAITSETRGQNSWLNYGPFGEANRTAKVDDTVFADQKIGLMPEWTWSEGRAGDMEVDIMEADTTKQSNLQKALDALDKIEKDLDKFGKETLGVNISVALAKTIVKAVKALVKAGVSLEQAIKQVAAENNLSEREVGSLIKPTKVSEIDVNEVRAKARPGKRVSKGLSVKTVRGKKIVEETEDLSLEYVKQNAPKVFISNANIIAKFPLVAGKQKFKQATTIEQAQEIYDLFVREVADNLNYLMAEFKPEFREISTLWYDGANAIANDFAEQFDVSPEQAAGIIAAMSPQKDWYQNVRMAELVMMAYKDNPVMSQEMIDYQKRINNTNLSDGIVAKNLKRAEKAYKLSRTKVNKEALDQAKVKMQKAINKADAVIKLLEQYLGQNLKDVPANIQPYMVRTYHEVNTTKNYNIVAPDGSVQGVAKNADGQLSKLAWGSYNEIGKAVAIYNDGSQENITRSLGEMHKIRNFYNNIIDPMSADGDVTMDTHAIAAALLLPLSGTSTQVNQNFGTGTSNSDPFGIKGLYYAYAEAYALAAREAGLLPRQVQSITWEAVRGLYTDTFKRDEAGVAKINNIWKNYEDGEITINEAREQAKEAAGGIQDPTWAGGPLQDELGESVRQESVGSGSEGDGRDIIGGELGGEILTADTKNPTVLRKVESILNKADDDLAKFGRETLGINIPVATMRAIIKLAKVLVKTGITLQDAIIKAAEQKNVSAKDALNAIMFMSETIKQPIKKVLVSEAAALKSQLRLEARAAREAKGDLNAKRKALATAITGMVRQGKITAVQARSIINKVSRVNLDNPVMVERLINYAERVFDRADYQETLSKAAKIRKSIRRALKSKELQAEVAGMAKKFSSVDPFMVEDIDQYIENVEKVLNAVRPVAGVGIQGGAVLRVRPDVPDRGVQIRGLESVHERQARLPHAVADGRHAHGVRRRRCVPDAGVARLGRAAVCRPRLRRRGDER